MRLEQCYLFLQPRNLRIETRDVVLERLPFQGRVDDIVIGLDPAELEHQVTEGDDQQHEPQTHQDDTDRALRS